MITTGKKGKKRDSQTWNMIHRKLLRNPEKFRYKILMLPESSGKTIARASATIPTSYPPSQSTSTFIDETFPISPQTP